MDIYVVFQSCQSLDDHLLTTKGNPQPYLIASGTSKAQVFTFYIVLDRKVLPCQSCTSLGTWRAVFSVKYHDTLSSLYTFFCRQLCTKLIKVQLKKLQKSKNWEQGCWTSSNCLIKTTLSCFLFTSSFGSALHMFRHLKPIHGMCPGITRCSLFLHLTYTCLPQVTQSYSALLFIL